MENIKTTYNAATKIWSGRTTPRAFGKEYSVGKAVIESMLKNPTKIGQVCYHNDKIYTNKDLASLTISVAQHFTKLGVKQCDVIGVCASNSDFVAPLFFGALLKGLIVSSIGVSYDKDDIKHTFGITRPNLMFCDGDTYDKVKKALQELGLNITIYTIKDHIEGKPNINEFLNYKTEILDYDFEPLKMGPSQTATILCSSGTTGLPKGVTMSHEDLLNFQLYKFPGNDRFLNFSTIDWISGVYILLFATLLGQTRIISDKPFSTIDFFKIVEKYRVTFINSPPAQMAMALAAPNIKTADLSSLKAYFLGGCAASFAVIQQIKKYMPNAKFYNIYGLSETRNLIASCEYGKNTGCVGELCENLQVKILNNNGERLGPHETGELYFKTPYKWLGYYNNELATAKTMDAEGWIATGDLGYFDENGKLYVVDRIKDILKYNGYHYSPTEIEQVIHELDDVAQVCVCGLPDLLSEDLPTAAVVKKPGSKLTQAEVYEHVARRLTFYKHLAGGVYFLDKMPLTATGKILRSGVKKICENLRNEKNQQKIAALPA